MKEEREREHGAVHVLVDASTGVANRMRTVWSATNSGLAIVRLHGRNAEMWNAVGTASTAARYANSDDELQELAEPIRTLAARVTTTHVVFSNCYEVVRTETAAGYFTRLGFKPADRAAIPDELLASRVFSDTGNQHSKSSTSSDNDERARLYSSSNGS
ncbi:DUF72 domain-containing protein [Cupriavidus sp. RAF12]|uniref:DUF72 domain-containing protein n=1 Tax=Cupriavidus sp. RAF12 TaxID=3233050 RepID=UPI003F8D96F2